MNSEKKRPHLPETLNPLTGPVSRRSFLSSLGAVGVAATAVPIVAGAQTAPPIAPAETTTAETIEGAIPVRFHDGVASDVWDVMAVAYG